MKKLFTFRTLLLTAFYGLWCIGESRAQFPASSYGFTAESGTYTAIQNGTSFPAVVDDDVLPTQMVPIGFSFNFCGVTYTQIRAGSNGFMSFSSTASNTSFNDASSFNVIKPALFWLWDDLDGESVSPGTSSAQYETTGPVGSRVFTFEYKNWEWNWSSNVAGISVQIKLYEGTNVIEYVYEQGSSPGNPGGSSGASIGICDGATTSTYLSLNNTTANPTASSTIFTSTITTKPATGQIYRFTPPESCATVAGLPTSGTIELSSTEICYGGSIGMTVTTNVPFPPTIGITYEWQTSPTGAAPWTVLGTTTAPQYSTPAPAGDAYYRCEILCNGTVSVLTTPSSPLVTVTNPQLSSSSGGSRCGPGTVELTATASGGAAINWYTAPVGGASLNEGSPFSTPYLTETTTFYVAASMGGSGISGSLETIPQAGGNSCGGGAMFDLTPTATVNIDSFLARATGGGEVNIYYKLGSYVGSETNAGDWTLHETIPTGGAPYAANWQNVPLSTPLTLNGGQTYGIYINYAASYTNGDGTNEDASDANLLFEGGVGLCSLFGGTNSPRIFNGTIYYSGGGCEGAREPVVATVNPSTEVTYTYDSVLCNDAVTPITITSTINTYPSYNWTPSDYLFTNAAGTTPYTGGNASTVYFRSDVSGPHEVYLMAGDPTLATGCTYADTLTIWVQPGNISLNAMPDTICVSGSSELSLVPDTNYYPGTIQWQESADGVGYTDIAGANDVSYTTPELSDEYYYKVIVSEGNGVCTELTKHLLIADPQLLDRTDSFNCGPGTVILQAEASLNTGLFWYENETGGTPVGTGTPFETPYLLETDTFWVAAGVGGSSTEPTWIGSGTGTTGSNPNPFYSTYYANKTQFLITADELTAAGYTAGTIQSIGFDVLGVTTTLALTNFTITMGLTTSTTLSTASWEAVSEVYTDAAYTVQPNTVNQFVLTNPFPWDGVSNLVIGTCFANTGWNGTQTIRYTTGFSFNASHYHYADDANHCTTQSGSLNYTSTSRPNILFDIVSGCESPREPVIAYIHPDPVVDLGDDINTCVDSGTLVVLDAGLQPNSPVFEWDNGSTSQVRAVGESGTYSVSVTNQWGCSSGDTIDIILRENPNVDLGNDTSVCNGVTITLDAGEDGIEYFWNTGATTKTIEVNSGGQYNVFVTNEDGCVGMDTVVVNMSGELPTIQGIDIDNNGAFTFTFSAINPQNVIGYEWDFGDGSPLSYMDSPVHTYPGTGNYIVTLKLASSCGFYSDSTSTHIVSVNKVNVDENALTVYPNPASESATIISRGGLKLEQVAMYNVLGQLIQSAEVDNKEQHTLKLTGLASGVYTLQIQTDKGVVTRKLEIIK